MTLSKKSLLMTSRLCTFGGMVFGVGFSFAGFLSLRLAVCPFVFFVLDGCVTAWLRSVHDDERVNEVTKVVCTIGPVCMLACTLLCLPFYNTIPLVRAGCLMVSPSILAVGFSQTAWDTFCQLFVNFVIVAYCESEPTFLICLFIQSTWLVFAAWKGSELIRSVEREASFESFYDRMMQKLLLVLLDFTMRVEAVYTGDAALMAEPGEPPADAASAPDIAAWRVQEDNARADHFFGRAMRSTDVIDLMCSAADKDRVSEALLEATRSVELVPQLLSNVHMWCSCLAVASPATTNTASVPNAVHEEEIIEAVVDLIVVGAGPLSRHGLEQTSAVCIGVRAAGSASGNRLHDVTLEPVIDAPQALPESGRVGFPESHIPLSESTYSEATSSSASPFDEQISTISFPHVHSVSMLIAAVSDGLNIERMTFRFSKAGRPRLFDWVCNDEMERLGPWFQRNLNALVNGTTAASANYGHIRLASGHSSFLVAEDVVVERAYVGNQVWGEGGGEDDDQEHEGHDNLSDSVCATEGFAKEELECILCRLCFQGVSKSIWPPWLAAGIPNHYRRPLPKQTRSR